MKLSDEALALKRMMAEQLKKHGWITVEESALIHTAAVATKSHQILGSTEDAIAYFTPKATCEDIETPFDGVMTASYYSSGENVLSAIWINLPNIHENAGVVASVDKFLNEIGEAIDCTRARPLHLNNNRSNWLD